MKRRVETEPVAFDLHICDCQRGSHAMGRFEITRCPCGTWMACCEGQAQGFTTWEAAFGFADALSLRPRHYETKRVR